MTATRARRTRGVWLAALALGLLGASAHAADTTRARWLMGTLFTLRAPGEEPRVAAALEAALDTVAALEARLSNWRETSDVSRLNAAGRGVVVRPLAAVVDSALALAELTGGAFDPTVEPLVRAWDLRGDGRLPAEQVLAEARARVDWRRVRRASDLTSGEPRVDLEGTALDLGGIGKGFALDRAADVLLARGVASALLDAGGQQLSLAAAAPCSAWVSHPERRERPAVQLVFRGGSLSTSSHPSASCARPGAGSATCSTRAPDSRWPRARR
jgi:thiamine biosynthesis lipoprotein